MSSYHHHRHALSVPHPTVQRYAVRAIFESLWDRKHQQEQQQKDALITECLTSVHASAVVDEAVSQLGRLTLQGLLPPDQALRHLQVALEHAGPESLPSIIKCIGSICRWLLLNESKDVLQGFQSSDLHPFVKAYKSRKDSQLALVHETLFMLAQDEHQHTLECLHFLQPFIRQVLIQPLKSEVHSSVCRELHYNLAALASSRSDLGFVMLQVLLHYATYCSFSSAQEVEWTLIASGELVDALESVVIQASSHTKVVCFQHIIIKMLDFLIHIGHEIKQHRFSLLPILNLLGRMVKLQKAVTNDTDVWSWTMTSLAHLLAVTDLEDEQLALIYLARSLLRRSDLEGTDNLENCTGALPAALLWVFPTINVMPSSSSLLKESAEKLLEDLEVLLKMCLAQTGTNSSYQRTNFCVTSVNGQLAVYMHRLLQCLWFDKGTFKTWISLGSDTGWSAKINQKTRKDTTWLEYLAGYMESIVKLSPNKSYLGTHDEGLITWVCMVVSALILHPVHSIAALEVIAAIGKSFPIKDLSLVPVVLFYSRTLRRQHAKDTAANLLGLLKVLPYLAVHPMSASIVAEALQPMLLPKFNPVLESTAIRLLCKTWVVSSKTFAYLQVALESSHFTSPLTDDQTLLSRAASLLDVCQKDSDSGVDLVLSIQACIENRTAPVKALGLRSLSCLCKDDVVDFYTAWDVISYIFPSIPDDPLLAGSLCQFLQNGALDAAAYPDNAYKILRLLWKGSTINKEPDSSWWVVRQNALRSLSSYEVDFLTLSMGDDKQKHIQILLSERSPQALMACEELVVRFLLHEHKLKQRGQDDTRIVSTKLEKLLLAMPRVVMTSVSKGNFATECPFSYLLFNPSPPTAIHGTKAAGKLQVNNELKGLHQWLAGRESLFCEIANNINLQGNLIMALLCLQSWKFFIKDWLMAKVTLCKLLDTSVSVAAQEIMQVLRKVCEESIPRVAENAVLALAVLYEVSKNTPDQLMMPLLEHLEKCIVQYSHEYLQWTSALALGVVARCCDPIELEVKSRITNSLIKCLKGSDSDIVRGACSLALGFVCQNLFTGDARYDMNPISKATLDGGDIDILAVVFKYILDSLGGFYPGMPELLQKLKAHNLVRSVDKMSNYHFEPLKDFFGKDNECMWTVAGLAMALGSTTIAAERAGFPDLISITTNLLIISITNSLKSDEHTHYYLTIGALLSLPTCFDICLRLDIWTEVATVLQEIDNLYSFCKATTGSSDLLTMAVCLGSGNLLATILKYGTQRVPLALICKMMQSMKYFATEKMSLLAKIGGFIGLANCLGAGGALIAPQRYQRVESPETLRAMELRTSEPFISYPLLNESSSKDLLQDMVQGLVNTVVQASDSSIKSSAAWSLALMHKTLIEKNESSHDDTLNLGSHFNDSKMHLRSLTKGSTLYALCTWMLDSTHSMQEMSGFFYGTAISVLRCLRRAPELPLLEWGLMLRQLMHKMVSPVQTLNEEFENMDNAGHDDLYQECLLFALAHAIKQPSLRNFLDELCEVARLILLPPSLSGFVMLHMAEFSNIFSDHRMERFFDNVVELTSNASTLKHSQLHFSEDEFRQLRISFWNGLYVYLSKESNQNLCITQDKLFHGVMRCLEALHDTPDIFRSNSEESQHFLCKEWSVALDCISHAPKEVIHRITQLDRTQHFNAHKETRKPIFILCEMVLRCCLSPAHLHEPIKYLCNQEASGSFEQLLRISHALRDVTLEEKQRWLIEAIELTGLVVYPETALLFFALLTSCWNSFSAVVFLADPQLVFQGLPFTLAMLLSEEAWSPISKSVLDKAFMTMDRLSGSMPPVFTYLRMACVAVNKQLPPHDRFQLLDDPLIE